MAPNSFAISGGTPSAQAQAFSSQPGNGKNTGGADFAALLAGNTPNKAIQASPAPERPVQSTDRPSETQQRPSPEPIDQEPAQDVEEMEASEPVAAPVAPAIDTTQVVALTEALTQLRSDLAAGKAIDPELLGRLSDSLNLLAQQLGVDIDALQSPADLAALLNGVADDDTSSSGLFATLMRSLETATNAGHLAAQPTEAADAIAELNNKLAKLLSAMEGGEIDPGKLASLGLSADKPRPNDIEQALLRLAKTSSDAPTGPVLSTPSLKMSDQLLAGKTDDDASTQAKLEAPTIAAAQAASSGDAETQNQDNDGAPADRRLVAANANAKPAEAPPAIIPVSDTPTTPVPEIRIEAAALRTIPQTYLSSQQQLNIPAIAFEMSRQMEGGISRFQIRLDPAELGRIDVRLDLDQNGQLNAKLIVERPETLDMMQRDQRALERALQQAGIDAHRATLEFSLKQNDQHANRDGNPFDRAEALLESDDTTSDPVPQVTLYRGTHQASGLNILA